MTPPPNASIWVALIPLAIVALLVLRNVRERNLRVERLWLGPVVILFLTALTISQQGVPSSLAVIGLDVIALLVGGFLGWHRARFTNIKVNPNTHALTSQASPVGMLIILAIFAARIGLRAYATQNASSLGLSISDITDAFLILAVGVVCLHRLEIFMRATRLLNEARARSSSEPN